MSIYEMKKPKRINSVSVTIFIIALVLGYAGWALIPIYWPVFQLTGIMRGVCNDAYRIHDQDLLMKKLLQDGRRTGLRLSKDNFRLSRLPYSDEEVVTLSQGKQRAETMLRKRGKTCRLEMHYEDDYSLPLIEKTVHLTFGKTVESTLEQVKYESQCTCVRVPESGR